jgi:hypothetical protein
MDLSTVYQELSALDPEAFDVRLAAAIDEVAVRVQTFAVVSCPPTSGLSGGPGRR